MPLRDPASGQAIRRLVELGLKGKGAVEGESPVRPVRVFVTYEALANLDPSQVRDLEGALTTFVMNRSRIDGAASSKFGAGGAEAELYEGQALIILRTDDLT
jgi:hypothetical protein